MSFSVQVRRVAIRFAYVGLRAYWFLLKPQVVGVKCVLAHDDDVLLVRHTYGDRSWDFPGGTVKRREAPRDAARREMHEELGRRIDDWTALGEMFVKRNHHDDNLHLFLTRVPDRKLELDLVELAEADWFPRDALPRELGRYVRPIMARVKTA
jgi:8-oxo-dGTP pyrophosphatase MutT (NUDIX family)